MILKFNENCSVCLIFLMLFICLNSSPDFESVFKSCTNDCFALLETHLHPLFFSRRHELIVSTGHENHDSAVKSEDNISDGKVIPLASVLPTVSRTVHQILGGIPNNFLDVTNNLFL